MQLREDVCWLVLGVCILHPAELSAAQAMDLLCPPRYCPGYNEKIIQADELARAFIALRAQGLGYAEIGRLYGSHRGTVYRKIQQYQKRLAKRRAEG